jgi:hypothetical protein
MRTLAAVSCAAAMLAAAPHGGSNTTNYAVVWMAPKRDFAVLRNDEPGRR